MNNNLHSRRFLLQNETFPSEKSEIGTSFSVCVLMGHEQHLDYAKALCCRDGSKSEEEYLYCLFEIGNVAYWNL